MRTTLTHARILTLLAAILTLAACAFDRNYEGTEYRCDLSAECPGGFACSGGVCRSEAVLNAPCGTTERAALDFVDFDLDDLESIEWWYYDEGFDVDDPYMSFQDEQLVVTIPGGHASADAGIGTKHLYPFTGSSASIELLELPASDMGLFLGIADEFGRDLSWWAESGSLYADYDTGDECINQVQIPHDPVAHRWLRVRELDGQILWETSPDNAEWTVQASMDRPEFEPWVSAGFEFWKGPATAESLTLVVDNFNGGVSDMGFCHAASLQDDFEDGIRSIQWGTYQDGECEFFEQDGRLGFGFPSTEGAYCSYDSETYFDLSQSAVTVEAPLMDVPSIAQSMNIYLVDWQWLQFELLDGTLTGKSSLSSGNTTLFEVAFDPLLHRFWRLRGSGSAAFWEVSGDGRVWQTIASHTDSPLALDRTLIELAGNASAGQVSSAGVGFDNLNIAVVTE